MFRIAVLSIVLTFAVAPDAALLCELWCHDSGAPTAACPHHQEMSSAAVNGEDGCSGVVLNTSTFIREDGAHATVVSHPAPALVVPGYLLAAPQSAAGHVGDHQRAWPFNNEPLTTILRL